MRAVHPIYPYDKSLDRKPPPIQKSHAPMLTNIALLAGVTGVSLCVTACVGSWRKRGWLSFSNWWNGEGVPIFVVLWLLLAGVLAAFGFFRHV